MSIFVTILDPLNKKKDIHSHARPSNIMVIMTTIYTSHINYAVFY